MLQVHEQRKRIINVDETWLNETDFTRRAWFPQGSAGSMRLKAVMPSLSMITALDTEGRVFFSLSHSATNQDTLMLFLSHLARQLDRETPGWQEGSVILVDNATYHTGEEIRESMRKMQLPIMYSAPYLYSAAPIELLFSQLKLHELNLDHESTGKK